MPQPLQTWGIVATLALFFAVQKGSVIFRVWVRSCCEPWVVDHVWWYPGKFKSTTLSLPEWLDDLENGKTIAFTLQIAFELGHFLEIIESADAQSSGNVQQLHLLRLVGKQPSPILSLWVPVWALFDAWWKWSQLENCFQGCYFPLPRLLQEGMRLYQDNLTMKMPSTKIQIQEFEAPLAKKNVSVGEPLNDTLLRRPMVSSHSLSSYTCCGFLASS